tara:strand:- start:369 stop:800 length:432 start_codon:yes stop_codon:yes gene_type:complete
MIKHSKHYDEKDRNVDCNNSGEWHKMRGFVSTDKQDDSTINPKMLIPKEDLVKGHMHCSNPTIENILEDRGNTYGEFNGQAILSQGFKDNATKCDKWRTMHSNKKEALEMIMSKMARIINGDPNYKDSWTDIIGYAKLIEKDL